MNREEALEFAKRKIEEEKLKNSSNIVSRHITTLDEFIDNSNNLKSNIEKININSDKVDDLKNVTENISSNDIKYNTDLQKNMDIENVKDESNVNASTPINITKNNDNSIRENLTTIPKEKNTIIVDRIILEISVELTQEERNN
jgi:hypothetical protein